MKKIFTLIVACVATVSAMAQHSTAMNFIGNSDYSATVFGQTISGSAVKDTLVVADANSSIAFPAMTVQYMGSPMTVPAMKIANLKYTMTGNPMQGNAVFTWDMAATDTVINFSGVGNKTVKITSLHAVYTHATGQLETTYAFQYGSMPGVVTFKSTGYYTIDNAWKLVGRGTEKNPYKIYDAADFTAMATNCTATNTGKGEYFQMMNNVDFTGVTYSPIAYSGGNTAAKATIRFAGSFDGSNDSIKNLRYDNSSALSTGLFGSVDTTGVVKNIVIDQSCSFSSNSYGGAVVGMLFGTAENCFNDANVTTIGTAAGGIVGNIQSGATIKGCTNNGKIQASTFAAGIGGMVIGNAGSTFEDNINNGTIKVVGSVSVQNKAVAAATVAGIVGGGGSPCTVKNCTNNGTVTNNGFDKELYPNATYSLTTDGKNAGGIVGYTTAVFTVTGCTNNGTVTGLANAGGIIGGATKASTISSCTNNGVVTCTDAATAGNLRGSDVIVLGEGNVINASLAKLALDPDVTAINSVNADANTAKTYKALVNGRLVIVNGGRQYNAAGQRTE